MVTKPTHEELAQEVRELEGKGAERRQLEKDLIFKENIIRSSSSIIATCDLEGNMTHGNPAFLKAWGFVDPEEFLGKPFLEFWVAKPRLDEIMQSLQGEGTWFGELQARRKDGTLFDVEVLVSTVFDPKGSPVALTSTSIDITERKRALVELQKARDELEQRVQERTEELVKANEQLRGEIDERRQAEDALKKKTHDLGERVKELNCLYSISNLVETPGISLEEIIQGVADLIPPTWQYPEITCGRIILEGRAYLTNNFQETIWKQAQDIIVCGETVGSIVVCYLQEKPKIDEGPFLKEERSLINAIAERLGRLIAHKRAEEAYQLEQTRLISILEAIPDGVYIVSQQCDIEYINPVIKQEFGPIDGRKCYEYFHARTEVCPWCKNVDVFAGKSVQWEWYSSRNDRYYDLFDTSFKNSDGTISKFEIFHDITERKQAEDALEKYKILFSRANDLAYICDSRGNILYANDMFEPLTGQKPDKFIGKSFAPLFDDKNLQIAMDNYTKTLNGESPSFELEFKDTGIICEYKSFPYKDEKNNIIEALGIARDITERKKAEEEKLLNMQILDVINQRKEWKDCFEGILGHIKRSTGIDAVAIRLQEGLDFPYYVTQGFPAEFVEAERYLCARDAKGVIALDSNGNPYVECMCGNILCGRIDPSKDFFSDGGSFWCNHTSKLLEETTDEERQTRTRNRCNSEGYESVALIPVKAGNEILGLIQLNDKRLDRFSEPFIRFFEKLGKDIGLAFSRKKAKEALEKQRKVHQAIINKAHTHLVFLDTDCNFVAVNSKYAETCQRTPEELIGKNHFYLFPNEENEEIFRQVRDTGQPVSYHDKPFEFSDQPERGVTYWDWTLSPVFDDAGKVEGFVFSLVETTERKKAEEKIKASLKEKEVLLREIHHRVKNNLQVIISLLRLQSDKIKDKQYAKMLQESQERIKSMALIHEKLYQSEDLAHIDFRGYVKSLVNSLSRSYGVGSNKVRIKIDVEDIPLGLDNAIPTGMILNELVSNSLKYAFPEGRKGEINVIISSTGEQDVELTVSDNGIGIPEDLDIRNSDSLGLHLVTILTEHQLQGKLEIDRTDGAEFNIRFKMKPDKAGI